MNKPQTHFNSQTLSLRSIESYLQVHYTLVSLTVCITQSMTKKIYLLKINKYINLFSSG